MTRYRFIQEHKGQFGAWRCCRVLGVSPLKRFDWHRHAADPSARAQADRWLLGQIRRIHRDSGGAYGATRIHAELPIAWGCGWAASGWRGCWAPRGWWAAIDAGGGGRA